MVTSTVTATATITVTATVTETVMAIVAVAASVSFPLSLRTSRSGDGRTLDPSPPSAHASVAEVQNRGVDGVERDANQAHVLEHGDEDVREVERHTLLVTKKTTTNTE